MITLIVAIILLVLGYVFYGRFVEKTFGAKGDKPTPAYFKGDNVDFVAMPKWKNALIELLNIAGMGPIYGPILGVIWGPMAFFWIIIGAIFAGGVHDYFMGMISIRYHGKHLPQIAKDFLGNKGKVLMTLFLVSLLILVGTMFVISPASLINEITPSWITVKHIAVAIFCYYFLSTILPINKVIGKIYPIFGGIFFVCTLLIGISLFLHPEKLVEISFDNWHPRGVSIFPSLFIVISCGALSGFHATQSPLISCTLKNEKDGRCIFYGMMLVESLIAMIWAAATMAFIDRDELARVVIDKCGGPETIVASIATQLLGTFGKFITIFGIVILPLTSGDTAFRSARMIIGDFFNIEQKNISNRLLISLPLFVISMTLMHSNGIFTLWGYFSLANQIVSCLTLWISTLYLQEHGKNYYITAIPAIFITTICLAHIFKDASIGIALSMPLATTCAIVVSLSFSFYLLKIHAKNGAIKSK